MPSFSLVVLMGHLVRKPSLKESESGHKYLNNCICVNKYKKGEETPHFFDFTAFGKTAEIIANHIKQGSALQISGEPEQQKWVTEDDQNRSKVVFIAHKVTMLGKKNSEPNNDAEPEIADDDVPF